MMNFLAYNLLALKLSNNLEKGYKTLNEKFKGLTSAEVQASKNAHGDNRLSSKEANSLLSIFIEAFQDQWILILLAALGLKIIFNFVGMIFPAIGEANWYEAISLIFAILMSTGFSAVSQYRNEQKFNTLQEEASKLMLRFIVMVNLKRFSLMIL